MLRYSKYVNIYITLRHLLDKGFGFDKISQTNIVMLHQHGQHGLFRQDFCVNVGLYVDVGSSGISPYRPPYVSPVGASVFSCRS